MGSSLLLAPSHSVSPAKDRSDDGRHGIVDLTRWPIVQGRLNFSQDTSQSVVDVRNPFFVHITAVFSSLVVIEDSKTFPTASAVL
jgi:hypothetical protein